MKHCIIVKWNETVTDKAALLSEVRALFSSATLVSGVTGTTVLENCIARENRYDLAIVLDMDRDALPVWDGSELHKKWKADYGERIASKAIFDFEPEK